MNTVQFPKLIYPHSLTELFCKDFFLPVGTKVTVTYSRFVNSTILLYEDTPRLKQFWWALHACYSVHSHNMTELPP